MIGRRIVYLMSLIGCVGFYIAYREWMSWLFLMALLFLPWLSLLLSVLPMAKLKTELILPKAVILGDEINIKVRFRCFFPVPPVSWRYQIRTHFASDWTKYRAWEKPAAKHCGCVDVSLCKAWKYDYLGLFRWRLCRNGTQTVLVYPKEVPVEDIPDLKKALIPRWKVKGNGFSENYDMRPYRPGDSLRQIHWKLSAKTGSIIFREAVVPIRNIPVLTMILSGNADQIDEKLGKFKYLSKYLLQNDLTHELHCLSADGVSIYRIASKPELHSALTQMLRSPITTSTQIPHVRAVWKYHIGGETDEA